MRRELFCSDHGEGMKIRLKGMHFPGEEIRFFTGKLTSSPPTEVDLGEHGKFNVPCKVCDVCLKRLNPGDPVVGLIITTQETGPDPVLVQELRELIEEENEARPAEGT